MLFMFTGTHNDYHKPSDDEDKINYAGLASITHYAFNLINGVAAETAVPFTKTKIQQTRAVPKYKVTLGIMPSYADTKDGLHVDGVTENRPAAVAGIQQGDIVTKIGDCEIKEVYSYIECLSKIKPGDELPVTIKRGDEEKIVIVKF